jgi:hypothetical protein
MLYFENVKQKCINVNDLNIIYYLTIYNMIFFGSIFELLFFLYLANQYFNTYHHEQYNRFIVYFSYNFIYYFSFAQIKITKLTLILNDKYFDFIKSNPQLIEYINKLKKTEQINNNIEYISNNSVIFSETYEETARLYLSQPHNLPSIFDFIIYSDNINIHKNNKLILNELPKDEIRDNLKYNETKYNFVLSEITINDKTIKIDFKTDNYNFMIVNNKFNTVFINYFMKKYYSISTLDLDYKLKILDQNVNEVLLDATTELILKAESYMLNDLAPTNILCNSNNININMEEVNNIEFNMEEIITMEETN